VASRQVYGVFTPLIGTIGVADNGVPGGVPKFKTLPFTSVSVGGKSLGSLKPVAVDRYSGKILQLEPSAITGGNAFNMLFKHSCISAAHAEMRARQ